jgi:hypothetical protein
MEAIAMDTNPQKHDKSADTDLSWPDDPAAAAAAAGRTTPERSTKTPGQRPPSQHHNRGPPPDDDDDLVGDLLIGAEPIEAHLKQLGVPSPDAYYLRRSGKWPIGKYGANLIASKRRLNRHADKLTRGLTAA